MTDRELMQQALDALEIEQFAHKYLGLAKAAHIENTITALRERLAQQECVSPLACSGVDKCVYRAGAARQQPLTDEQIAVIAAACGGLASDFVVSMARAVEAAHGIRA